MCCFFFSLNDLTMRKKKDQRTLKKPERLSREVSMFSFSPSEEINSLLGVTLNDFNSVFYVLRFLKRERKTLHESSLQLFESWACSLASFSPSQNKVIITKMNREKDSFFSIFESLKNIIVTNDFSRWDCVPGCEERKREGGRAKEIL